MLAGLNSQLNEACQTQALVRIERRFEDDWVDGFIVNLGLHWFCVAVLDDCIKFDGFQLFRCKDVLNLEIPSPREGFIKRILDIRKDNIPKTPTLDLRNLKLITQSIIEQFPLITLHEEEIDNQICHIGKIITFNDTSIMLHEIDSDAIWENETSTYDYQNITRIDIASSYEATLSLIALSTWEPESPPLKLV
jgi:hypothetical protein